MQQKEMHTAFGVLPPSTEQETMAQSMMAADDNCHAFVVCSKTCMDDRSPVHLVGRAQVIIIAPGVAQLHIGGDFRSYVCIKCS
jgi:hypothetical protein